MGPSGSGKSTFLNVAAGLDRPTQGSVWLGDIDIGAFNLLPSLTVSQNISLPVHLGKGRLDRAWLDEVVARTGLGARLRHRPSELSGGQQQRVALARALVTRPDVLFADEPTGALDTKTSGEVLRLIREIADRTGQTVVMVTHDPTAAAYADRVVFLADGRLAGALEDPSADAVAERLTRLGDWAVSNMRTASRRFASAMTPIVLTVAISSTLLFSGTTREHATAEQSRHRVSAGLVIQSDGVGIPRSALDDARRVEDVATAVGITETSLGPSLGSDYVPAQAAVVDPLGIDRVLDLDVRNGSIAAMRDDTVALSTTQAETAHAEVGDQVDVTLGDGVRRKARVVAIYRRALGFGDVVLPTAMADRHLTSPLLTAVLIRTTPGAAPSAVARRLSSLARAYPGLRVRDRHALAERVDANRAANDWLFRILAGIIFVFTSIAVVNTLVMIALHRTRELALLRLVGGTSRQVLSMARWEGGMVVALGVGIGGAIALITLVPASNEISGSSIPYAPPGLLALVLASAACVGLLATQLTTRLALRPRPIDGIGLRD